jgi:hypothetical protein
LNSSHSSSPVILRLSFRYSPAKSGYQNSLKGQ